MFVPYTVSPMPISTSCDACGWSGKFKDVFAGMRGKCPGCGQAIRVPAADDDVVDDGFEVVDDDEDAPAERNVSERGRPAKARGRDDRNEKTDKRASQLFQHDEVDNYSRPAKSRRRDDADEADQPSRSRRRGRESSTVRPEGRTRKKKAKESQPLTGTAAMFAGIGMMLGAVVWFILGLVHQDKIYFYPPILFILGVGTFIRGMKEEEDRH
jgi:hypothetical protein